MPRDPPAARSLNKIVSERLSRHGARQIQDGCPRDRKLLLGFWPVAHGQVEPAQTGVDAPAVKPLLGGLRVFGRGQEQRMRFLDPTQGSQRLTLKPPKPGDDRSQAQAGSGCDQALRDLQRQGGVTLGQGQLRPPDPAGAFVHGVHRCVVRDDRRQVRQRLGRIAAQTPGRSQRTGRVVDPVLRAQLAGQCQCLIEVRQGFLRRQQLYVQPSQDCLAAGQPLAAARRRGKGKSAENRFHGLSKLTLPSKSEAERPQRPGLRDWRADRARDRQRLLQIAARIQPDERHR